MGRELDIDKNNYKMYTVNIYIYKYIYVNIYLN